MSNIIQGDLIELAKEGEFDVIIHGCNCFCKMGRGIALQIKNELPDAYDEDQQTKTGDESKLGDYTSVKPEGYDFEVVNAYTQLHWGAKKVNANYDAIRSVFKKIKRDFSNLRIGYPLIGAGLAGGDWDIISKIIDEELEGEDHTLVEFKNGKTL